MKLSERLLEKAAYFRGLSPSLVAVDHLKKAGLSEEEARFQVDQHEMEKSAAAGMVAAGVDYDKALAMVKQSGIKINELDGYKPEVTVEELAWDELMKMAAEAQALEDEMEALRVKAGEADAAIEKAAHLEDVLSQVPEQIPERPEAIVKMASTGAFTNEDLEALLRLPSETLTKVAAAGDAPWSMGKAAGLSASSVDPIVAFSLGE